MPSRWSELTPEGVVLIRSWPPVALVSSARLAKALGVSAGTLRNWRYRNQGPSPEPRHLYGRGNPTPTYFCVANILAWLDGAEPSRSREYERDWLIEHFLGSRFADAGVVVDVHKGLSTSEVAFVAASVRGMAYMQEFNEVAQIEAWPGTQPRKHPHFHQPAHRQENA
jgi:hypothetical protein